jgi:eukaryotic-like serine/threonine-protein kinase
MIPDADALLGRLAGPYRLDRLLGQGGFSWVFAGHHDTTGTPVAVKVLKPRYAGDPQFQRRFQNETEVASHLEHPNIVRIHEVGSHRDVVYFAMDLHPDSLGQYLAREGPVPEARLLTIARDITGALSYAHAQKVIHRDIKVDNILLAADGRAILTDFGIARVATATATATGPNMTIGTPHYISPEQAQGRPLDGRADLYALGVTLYKAATGELPFRSSDWFELARMHVEEPPTPPTAHRPELSHRFERVMLRCLAKHPDDRYPSADALATDLDDLIAGRRQTRDIAVPRMRATTNRQRGMPPARRWLRRLGAVVIVVLVALVVVLLARR